MNGSVKPSYVIKPSIQKLAQRLAAINVLIADSDPRISHLVRDVLENIGFRNIFLAKDGSAGLRTMEETTIDLIITDWEMTPLDGISFIRHLRTSPDSPNRFIPIILLTGNAEKDDVIFARDAGITEFVVKPFTAKTLYERIILVIENPRSFIISKNFKGPDRRRRKDEEQLYSGPNRRRIEQSDSE